MRRGQTYVTGVLGLVAWLMLTATLAAAQSGGFFAAAGGGHHLDGPERRLLQPQGRTTGLLYQERGLRSPPNTTRRNYGRIRTNSNKVGTLGSGLTPTDIAQVACGTSNIFDTECIEVLLLMLTPQAVSSNKTTDTPGGRAFISPAQNQGSCGACVGFTVTAAAEAAVNVFRQQQWHSLGLSEQDLSFCRLEQKVNCKVEGTGSF